MIIARCQKCHQRTQLPEGVKKLECCPNCKETNFIQYYEHLFPAKYPLPEEVNSSDIVKGGDENMSKKENTEEVKTEKVKKEKGPSITELRVANANKVLAFIKTLGVEGDETSKVLSRSFLILKQK